MNELEQEDGCGLPPDAIVAKTLWAEAHEDGIECIRAVASVIWRQTIRRIVRTGDPWDLAISKTCLTSSIISCWKNGAFAQEPYDCPEWTECDHLARLLVSGTGVFKPTVDALSYFVLSKDEDIESYGLMPNAVTRIGKYIFY
jgi:hypothetical protein